MAAQSHSAANHLSPRISFAKFREPMQAPNLLSLQTESFEWLLGTDQWRARVEAANSSGRKVLPETSGLEDIFNEISPIEDVAGTMSLAFREFHFEPPKYSVEQCREKDKTYEAPLYVQADFMNHTTGEIKSQTVFLGEFPLMTPRGTFIINGTERVVVSQLVRSPGVYFEAGADKTSDRTIYTAKIFPPAVRGSSLKSTNATPWGCGSTANANSR